MCIVLVQEQEGRAWAGDRLIGQLDGRGRYRNQGLSQQNLASVLERPNQRQQGDLAVQGQRLLCGSHGDGHHRA